MGIIEAITLGILQGLGEFLPVSSSGHLIVVPWLLGWPEHSLAFDVALHLGTLAAMLAAFAPDWWRLGCGFSRGLWWGRPFAEPEGRLLGLLALATVPGAIAGKLLEECAETAFRSPGLVAAAMAGMGVLLLLADRRSRAGEGQEVPVTWVQALLIGLAQAAAIFPGISRSGATITMALFLGFRRSEAARFSFLLAAPITLGAVVLKVPSLFATSFDASVLLGIASSAVVGFLAIRVLLAYVRTHSYLPFVWYRLAFAVFVALVLLGQ